METKVGEKKVNNIREAKKADKREVINLAEKIQSKPKPTGREAWKKQTSFHRT